MAGKPVGWHAKRILPYFEAKLTICKHGGFGIVKDISFQDKP
jgi:hypothetical protein